MIYTGIADANGDFIVPFSSSYTSGQKITVTAEKDNAQKKIELFAPSGVMGGGGLDFSGSLNNFPNSIGVITLNGLTGGISDSAFAAANASSNIFRKATGLIINDGITSIGANCFTQWISATQLVLPNSILTLGNYAFQGWSSCLELIIPASISIVPFAAFKDWLACKKVIIPPSVTTINGDSFANLNSCDEIIFQRDTPPNLPSAGAFSGLKSTCVFKVPIAALSVYQNNSQWSSFASRMIGV